MTNKMPSQVQDSEVGDETTSVTVLASEFIRETEKLVEMIIHPQVSLLLLLLHLLLLVFLPFPTDHHRWMETSQQGRSQGTGYFDM